MTFDGELQERHGDRDAASDRASSLRSHNRAAIALLVLHGTLAWVNRTFAAGLWHDEANYLLLARSIRQLGYHDLLTLGSPLHTHYPPGFPTLLAFWSLPIGENVQVLIAVVVLCSVGALALLYDVMRRRAGPGVALTVLALSALNPELVLHAGRPLSEAPYMLFATLALWAVLREPSTSIGTGRPTRRWALLAIAAALCAALTRLVGVTMVGALFFHWLLERRFRRALVLGVAGAISVGSWLAWSVVAPNEQRVGRSYIADATFSDGPQQSLLGTLAERVTTNISAYATEQLQGNLPQPTIASVLKRVSPDGRFAGVGVVDNLIGIAALLSLGVIGVWALWKQARLVIMYLGLYALLLVVWPFYQGRFLVPVLPILHWVVVSGAVGLSVKRRWLRPVPFVIAGGILAMAVARDIQAIRDTTRCVRADATTSVGCFPEAERGFFAAMSFIRRSTPDSAIFMAGTDHQLSYFTERRVLLATTVEARDHTALLAELRARGVEYVFLTPVRAPYAQLFPVLKQGCGDLEVVKEFPAVTLLLRVIPEGRSSPHGIACADLQRYEKSGVRSTLW